MSADNHLNQLIKELFAQAVKDNIITDEEYMIIQSIEIEVDQYIEGLEFALEDGIIDKHEKEKLEKLKDAILNKAQHTAEIDGIIDEDEKDLLRVLKSILALYF